MVASTACLRCYFVPHHHLQTLFEIAYDKGCYRYLSLPWGQPEPRGWWLMPREELPPFLLDGIQPLGLNSFSDTLLRALTCRYNSGLMFHKLWPDRKSTRLNSSHLGISYAVFC